MRLLLFATLIFGLFSCNPRDSITRFSEEHEMDRQHYVYPSTLRMLNLKQNEEYNQLIENFVKGQYHTLSVSADNSVLIDELKEEIIHEGYEIAMTLKDKDRDLMVYVLEKKVPKIAAIYETDTVFHIIQAEGLINIAKIPKLLENFDDADYLNALEVIQKVQTRPDNEHHSQN